MSTQDLPEALRPRKRGAKRYFTPSRITALTRYLSDPEATIQGAADRFGCSRRLIEKTLTELRRIALAEGTQ